MRLVGFRMRATRIIPSGLLRRGGSTVTPHTLISLGTDSNVYIMPQDRQMPKSDPSVVTKGFIYMTATLMAHRSFDRALDRDDKIPFLVYFSL